MFHQMDLFRLFFSTAMSSDGFFTHNIVSEYHKKAIADSSVFTIKHLI